MATRFFVKLGKVKVLVSGQKITGTRLFSFSENRVKLSKVHRLTGLKLGKNYIALLSAICL